MQSDDTSQDWLAGFVRHNGPLYLQIVRLVEQGVASGTLRAGDRMTPQREVAARLGVDLTTVTRAYDEGRRRQLLVTAGRRGTYVAARRIELVQMVDLSLNIPPPPADLDLGDLLRKGLNQALLQSDADLLMTYHLGGGSELDRTAAALWLAPMLGPVDPALITAVSGAQAALCALIMATTRPDDVLLCDSFVYPGFRSAAAQLGRRVEDVDSDDSGMTPESLEQQCRRFGAKLLYLNPTIQNPTTVTMPERRRKAIARLAARLELQVIEDDPYWLLADQAPPPFTRFAPERTHYVSTLSKCLCPGLRTAFVRSPCARSRAALLDAVRSFSLMRAPLSAVLVTQWINDGTARRLLAGVRAETRARQRLAAQSLAGMHGTAHMSNEGAHLWHRLPSYWTPEAFVREAGSKGLAITPSDAFASAPRSPAAIRISLGGVPDRRQLALALGQLTALLARVPDERARAVI